MKKKIIWLLSIVLLIVSSNIKPTHYLFSYFLDWNHYKYSTGDGGFTFTEEKARDTAMMFRKVKYYKEKKHLKTVIIYRTFSKNPLAFWRWRLYYTDKRYDFPYKSCKEIKRIRGYDLKNENNFQDF